MNVVDDRPTLIYDATVPWRNIGDGDQRLVDAIRTKGAIVRVKARERPYTEVCTIKTLARWDVYHESGAVFDKEGPNTGRFVLDTPNPQDPHDGVLRMYDYVQRGGDSISIIKGHYLQRGGELSGINHPRGGDSGIFGSHAGSRFKAMVLHDVKWNYFGSHGAYVDGTVGVVIGGEAHSADPRRDDDKGNQYDSARFLLDFLVMRGTKLYTTDPDPSVTRRGHSSMVLGLVSCQHAWLDGITIDRTTPPRGGSKWGVGIRARESFGGADRVFVGDNPPPGAQLIASLGNKWAWCAPFATNEHGVALRPYRRNPAFFEPAIWEQIRAAGIATDRERFFNPHSFHHVFTNPIIRSTGRKGVGILAEGSAPMEPVAADGLLHDPPVLPANDLGADDQLDLLPGWVERDGVYVIAPDVEADSDDFQVYLSRDASKFVPGKATAAWVAARGDGAANDTTTPVYEYRERPEWMPYGNPLVHVPGFAEVAAQFKAVFPDYGHHLDVGERRTAAIQRRAVDRRH